MPPNAEETRSNRTQIDTLMSSPCFPITLQFMDISYRIKLDPVPANNLKRVLNQSPKPVQEDRIILNDITGQVSPGEMLALLGPSGSGKSTLLTILSGRFEPKYRGSVLANGARFTKPVLKRVGFVTQDDILYPHLTVRETLVFCAMLRLPRNVTRQEKVRAAEGVINELGLGRCADTSVGNAFVRGVSGGERKRVAIGHEMLVNPSLLLLDEPTSGLDSTAAGRLVSTLGGMARKGRTVVLSVHQPSSGVYQLFDSVMLLCEGNCAYFGKGKDAMEYFRAAGFVPRFHVNPADFMLDLANGYLKIEYDGDAEEKASVKQLLISSYNGILASKVKASVATAIDSTVNSAEAQMIGSQKEQKNQSSISWFSQFTILLHRSLKERRHETFNSLRVFQVIAASLLSSSMWFHSSFCNVQDRFGLLFFITIFWGVFASFNAVYTFPQERAIFVKERASRMYTLSSYFMARMAGDLPMELVLPSIFAFILYWLAGLRPEIGAFFLTLSVLLGYVLVAQGLGLAIGAAIMNAKQASTTATIIMLAFLLTGGFYVQHVPSCMAWMKYTSLTFYCYRLLVGVQYRGTEIDRCLSLIRHGHGHRSAEEGIEKQVTVGVSVAALVTMFVGYRILAYAALRKIKV